jgi:PIN domain nuclease of toxin-antitoxin system
VSACLASTLDASAMTAFLAHEPGGEIVRDLLADPVRTCYAHALNLCEVFYDFHRAGGEAAAQEALSQLFTATLQPRSDFDTDFWQAMGRLKSVHRRVSLADCCCIALAQRVGGDLVTADRHELGPLEPLGLCPMRFIR